MDKVLNGRIDVSDEVRRQEVRNKMCESDF
jgi:hypothetical protein